MTPEQPTAPVTTLPPRAGIALLTLQLRAAVQDAEAAEAEADAIDLEGARQQLRARLAPLLDERRRALHDELAAVRADAAAAIAAAHEAAAAAVRGVSVPELHEVVEQAMAAAVSATTEPPVAAEPEPEPEPELPPVAAEPEPEPELPPVAAEPMPEPAPAPVPAPTPISVVDAEQELDALFRRPATEARVGGVAATTVPGAPVHISIDAEAFARVFATVFATVMEERLAHLGPQHPTGQLFVAPAPVAPKPSVWASARHLDVLLLGLATVIVLVVIAAWMA